MKKTEIEICPCDTGLPYVECCRRYHLNGAAPTPLALMRSRYSAYAKNFTGYVENTWHISTRPIKVAPHPPEQKWLRLAIKRHTEHAHEGIVEFIAVSKINGRATRLHETSRFLRENSQWFYVDAIDER